MSVSPDSSLVRRTIDHKYAEKQRSSSIKWIFINGALFILFTLDLWYACPGHTSALHYVEAGLACAAAASAVRHAARLLAGAGRAPPLSAAQRRLLGLPPAPAAPRSPPPRPAPAPPEETSPLSARAWRPPPGAGSGGAPEPPSPPSPPPERAPPDCFIADQQHLHEYLESARASALQWQAGVDGAGAGPVGGSPPLYQLSPLRGEVAAARAPPGAGAAHGPWRRLRLEPARLAALGLNLRRWLHDTVLARLVRELDAVDALLAGAGQEARAGGAAPARLEALAGGATPALAARVRALLPFLRPFPEQAYVVRRVRELARAPCLPAYRWAGGGAGWTAARCPPDAELLLHLLCAYLDSVAPGEGGAFSAAHVSSAPAPPRTGPGALALHRASPPRAPPHYVVVAGEDVLEPAPGRDNMLHAVLVFLAVAARREPPALLRLHLGPAGLNMLWILER